MYANGTIRCQKRMPSATNQWGEPIAAEVEWSDEIPCEVQTLQDNRIGKYEGGEFHQASYRIIIADTKGCDNIDTVEASRQGEPLGEFQVISIERVPRLGRIKITI